MQLSIALLVLAFTSYALGNPQHGSGKDDGHDKNDGDYDGDDVASSATPSFSSSLVSPSASPAQAASSSANSTASTNSTSPSSLIGMNGDVVCTDLLCVGGLVNGSTITYTLQSIGAATLGWMAMGFGAQMANTPMVIIWPNSDGSFTLSQRKAPAEVMPTVDANPPRIATLETTLCNTAGSNPKVVFTIPADGSPGVTDIIWAFGGINPDDSSPDATLQQHIDSGPQKLNLGSVLDTNSKDPTNPIRTISQGIASPDGSGSNGGNGGGNTTPTTSFHVPLLPFEKYIVAHAILCVIGFLGLLPLGAIVARWTRAFSPVWFNLHWIIQFGLALPVIVAGVACGITAVHKNGTPHVNDTHKKWGIAIFVLYFFQLFLGATIHWFKPSYSFRLRGRSLQNYFHAIVGILLIGVAFYQVRTGFRVEWPLVTGRGKIPNGANIVWIIWLVLIPLAYFSGMLLLRRQYRQEAQVQKNANGGISSTTAPATTY